MKHPQQKPQTSFDVDRFIEEAATAAADEPPPKLRGRKKTAPKPKPETAKPRSPVEDEAKTTHEAPKAPPAPIVLDVGKVKGKRIKKLKRGAGPLLDEVRQAVASVHSGGKAAGRDLVPVVVLVERKRKKKRGWLDW